MVIENPNNYLQLGFSCGRRLPVTKRNPIKAHKESKFPPQTLYLAMKHHLVMKQFKICKIVL